MGNADGDNLWDVLHDFWNWIHTCWIQLMPIYNDNKTKKILSVNCFDSSFVKGKIGGEAIKASYCIAKSHISLRGSSHSGGSWQTKKCNSFLLCKNSQKLRLGKKIAPFQIVQKCQYVGVQCQFCGVQCAKEFCEQVLQQQIHRERIDRRNQCEASWRPLQPHFCLCEWFLKGSHPFWAMILLSIGLIPIKAPF